MNNADLLTLFQSQTIGASDIPTVLLSIALAFAVGVGMAGVSVLISGVVM